MVKLVPEKINFPQLEEEMLEFWQKHKVFEESLERAKNRPKFNFYDGPPFATGLPHYGHILAGTIKDVVTRWASLSGFYVERRFGWDCHGLPVEYEIDKLLGIKGPADVEKMGVAAYNAECRKIVMRYSGEWEVIVTRLGRWIDFKNDYKTMYPWFMESVWWVFKQLFEKGLVYRGFKVMPYSTACNTPLSNFEAGQNYKDVVDPAVVVTFPLLEDPDVSLVAWTTTPWTLPSNLAVCVNPDEVYVKIREVSSGSVYIVMEKRVSSMYKEEAEYNVLESFAGVSLQGIAYKPLFNYFEEKRTSGAFRVLVDCYVSADAGTGVVHQAPYFGEEDYRICMANGVIERDGEIVCPVDESGCFTSVVSDFKGQYVKEADKDIIRVLRENGRLVSATQCKHSYPFCWRSDTPLIYKAVPSWFVRVESVVDRLLANNSQTYWVPGFVQSGRFHNWLKDARDWAISRNRYWGTPLPLWSDKTGDETICVGSVEELEALSGVKVTDLHRESVDHITIPSRRGDGSVLRRVSEVFDCWFESGSMPYAQKHYPFEGKREFEDGFPADFIAEGIDQTRGWFYTLLVLSTMLFDKPPFKNVIVNGLVLAENGEKMSKRKKNYPDPMNLISRYGSDALRLYLITSPAVRADNLLFKEEGVKDMLKEVSIPLHNAYRFLVQNVFQYEKTAGVEFYHDKSNWAPSDNLMDQWIISYVQSLIKFMHQEMKAYRLYTVVPRLTKFVDQLTNWFVRMNRKRLKGESGEEDCRKALETLFVVLFTMTKMLAAFIPFLTESMYQNLRTMIKSTSCDKLSSSKEEVESIHFLTLPKSREDLILPVVERAVADMQCVIEAGRAIRDRNTLPMKYPLKGLVVLRGTADGVRDIDRLSEYIEQELNVSSVEASSNMEKYCVTLTAQPDHKVLGTKCKDAFREVMKKIKSLTDSEIKQLRSAGSMEIAGFTVTTEEVHVSYTLDKKKSLSVWKGRYQGNTDESGGVVLLDVTKDEGAEEAFVAREFVNRVQKIRKAANLLPTDDITVYHDAPPSLSQILTSQSEIINSTLKQPVIHGLPASSKVLISETVKIKKCEFTVAVAVRVPSRSITVTKDNTKHEVSLLSCDGKCFVTLGQLLERVNAVFGCSGEWSLENGSGPLSVNQHLDDLVNKTLTLKRK